MLLKYALLSFNQCQSRHEYHVKIEINVSGGQINSVLNTAESFAQNGYNLNSNNFTDCAWVGLKVYRDSNQNIVSTTAYSELSNAVQQRITNSTNYLRQNGSKKCK